MNAEKEAILQDILAEPYWSIDDIIDLALIKFTDRSNPEDHHDKYKYAINVINDIYEIADKNKLSIVPTIDKSNKYVKFLFSYKYQIIISIIVVVTGLMQLFIYYFSIIFELAFNYLNNTNVKLTAIDRLYISWLMIFMFPLAILLKAVDDKVRDNDRKLGCESSKDKFNYLYNKARRDGLVDQYYVSDAIIDYLNDKYKFYLPRDPFRVWKEPFFKRNGDFWIIGFQGKRICLKDATVMEPLAYLLNNPNKEFYAHDFLKAVEESSHNIKMETSSTTDDIDNEYQKLKHDIDHKKLKKSDIERLIDLLKEQLNESETQDDKIECEHKIKLFKQYISESFTRDGREKPIRDKSVLSQEALEQSIKRFMSKLKDIHPALADHFKSIRKSTTFCYRPPDDITWDVQF